MADSLTQPVPPDRAVRMAVAAAARRRRAREAERMVWRAAPWVGGAALFTAVLSHLAGVPRVVPYAVTAAGAVGLVVFALAARRFWQVTGATVSAIDADARLGGELQSASWFASRPRRDEWADYHVAAAAERLSNIDWRALYPPARNPRARLLTVGAMIVALVLAWTAPEPVAIRPAAAASDAVRRSADRSARGGEALLVPPELQQKLQELLAAAERGDARLTRELSAQPELRDMLNRLTHLKDAELLEALAQALADSREGRTAAEEMEALAERARHAAASEAMSQEMREALEALADELQIASPEIAAEAPSSTGPDGADGSQPDSKGESGPTDQVSIQFAQEAESAAGLGMMMATPDDLQGSGPPGGGFAGGTSSETAEERARIDAALRQEIVDASAESPGRRVAADIRRRTEQGDAQLSFTRGATRSFDPTRAVAPPPVPETRRAGVQTYFQRKP